MADGTAGRFLPPGERLDHKVGRWIAAVTDESPDHAKLPTGNGNGAAIVLSPSSDVLGIGPGGWLAAISLYVAALVAAHNLAGMTQPPEPWPMQKAAFHVVFETPTPPAPAQPEPLPAAGSTAAPDPAPSPPAASVEPETAPVMLPPPPLPKPSPPHSVAPARATPAIASAEPSAAPAPEQQPAAAPPPQVAALMPPRPISGVAGNPNPDYPLEARRRGLQGRVMLRVEVSAAGLPLAVNVASSSGHAALDRAAIAAVERWRFVPATQAGVPVPGRAEVPIQFRLED
jgi:periplasmic protein TonB